MADREIPIRPEDAPAPRPAATVVLLRDGDDGPEVLLLRRHSRSGFAPSAWVFPGGVVDAADAAAPASTWTGLDPHVESTRTGIAPDPLLALHVAAVRETFEEAGVLLAADGADPADLDDPAWAAVRVAMNDREQTVDWGALLAERGVVLDLSGVTMFARWITPIQEPRRYDTAFFAARLPDGAVARQDDVETTDARWIRPADALAADDVQVIFPTARTLEVLATFDTVDDALAHARGVDPVPPIQPHILLDGQGGYTDILLPDDPRYPHEVYR